MDSNEFNERVEELVAISESKVVDEFSNANEYDSIPESGDDAKARKAKKIKEASIAFITLLAGGGLTLGATISSGNTNNSFLEVTEITYDSVMLRFGTEYENLTVRFYNDFESLDGFIEYDLSSNGQASGPNGPQDYYFGICGCRNLKSFTKYTVVLEGEKVLGNATKAKIKVTTTRAN